MAHSIVLLNNILKFSSHFFEAYFLPSSIDGNLKISSDARNDMMKGPVHLDSSIDSQSKVGMFHCSFNADANRNKILPGTKVSRVCETTFAFFTYVSIFLRL